MSNHDEHCSCSGKENNFMEKPHEATQIKKNYRYCKR